MKITSVHIENFRGLKDVTVPLSEFGCLIGENNAGKSSVLQALLVFLPSSSRRPTEAEFFDKTRPIRIELQIDEVTDDDLARITNAQHRASFAPDVVNGSVRLVRLVEPESKLKPQLLVARLGPPNENWTAAVLDPEMKGKSGDELRAAVVALIPELDQKLAAKPTQTAVRQARDELVSSLAEDEMVLRDEPLGTGIEAGIKNFLPEPIYIEAVKEVADEMRTSDSSTFGKLLGVLLEEVQGQFEDVETQFREIQRKLSRVVGQGGELVDERIEEVKSVEKLINKFVQESFPSVDLTISVPVPKMKTILSSAEISADDGHNGPIASKGDGLKRAVAFAVLRAYTNFRSAGIANGAPPASHYWLLFEEPELYLYPRAQKQLFSALELFSKEHPVMVTTHSPIFFDASSTRSFIKFEKVYPSDGTTPHTRIRPIVIDDVPTKTAFQIICHENNSIGFFAKRVVLVEGDSDALLLQHLAKLINPSWDAVEHNIAFARTNGKGNIQSYRSFFKRFGIPVHVICDLDTLINGFDKLEPDQVAQQLRGELLSLADRDAEVAEDEITHSEAASLAASGDVRRLWQEVESAKAALDEGIESRERLFAAVEKFFDYRKKSGRLDVLRAATDDVEAKKQELLAHLRQSRTHVLSLGALEQYYASRSSLRDKVRQAIEYCASCASLEQYKADLGERAELVEEELRVIMRAIFEEDPALTTQLADAQIS